MDPVGKKNTGQPGLSSPPAPPYEALDFSDDSDSLEDSSPPCDSSHIARPIVLPLLMCTLALLIVNLVSSLHYEVSLDCVVSLNGVIVCVVLASLALALRGSLRASYSSLCGSLRNSWCSSVDALDARYGIVFLIFYLHVVYPLYLSYLS